MARRSVCERFEIFVAAAVLAAHTTQLAKGFRQIDVCWFVEIFNNWLEFVEESPELNFQSTQIARYLERLVEEGWARRISRGKHPLYRLTRTGLIEVGRRVKHPAFFVRREYFFFVYFMARAYRQRMIGLVEHSHEHFSPAVRVEMEKLLNTDMLLDDQIADAARELKKLDRRLEVVARTQRLASGLMEEGRSVEEILAEIDRQFPFGIDQQRRHAELFAAATGKQALWELTLGNLYRLRCMWLPARNMLAHYLEELKTLKNQPDDVPPWKAPPRTP